MFHVGVSLSVAMLWARDAWGQHVGSKGAPTEISPFRVNVVAELALVVLIMSAIHTEVNREELGERGVGVSMEWV